MQIEQSRPSCLHTPGQRKLSIHQPGREHSLRGVSFVGKLTRKTMKNHIFLYSPLEVCHERVGA